MGTKLQKTVDYYGYQVVTDYRDGFQYETKPEAQGGYGYPKLQFFPTAEGYVKTIYKPDISINEPIEFHRVYKPNSNE